MKTEIRKQWVAALRSGEYKQGTSVLHSVNPGDGGHRYCCLGVLCDLAVKAGVPIQVVSSDGTGLVTYGGQRSYPPESVVKWAGLEDYNPMTPRGSLSHLNDAMDMTFAEIADVIDEHLRESADA